MRLFWFSTLVLAASAAAAAPAADAAAAKSLAAWGAMPLVFESNAGQWNSAVRYAVRTSSYSALFTAAGPSLTLGERSRVDIATPGSNPAPGITGLDPVAARTNYMRGSRANWRFGIANYGRIQYTNVYPGVDIVYYGTDGQLEYDFVLQPGADPSAIRLKFHGANGVSVSAQGDLVIATNEGDLVQKRPVIYQNAKDGGVRPVTGRYAMLGDGEVGVTMGQYDRSLPLVIDPVLVFSSYLGGKAEDRIQAIKVDSQGKLYIVGFTYTGDLVATEDAYKAAPNAAGVPAMFIAVARTTSAGGFSLQYLTYLGGTTGDRPSGMDLDAEGNVYIAGTTVATDFPMAGASYSTTLPSPNGSVFVVKMNPAISGTDSLIYSTFLGGAGVNTANGMAVDRDRKIYVIGTTTSEDFPVTDSAYAGVRWGESDAFLTKIDTESSELAYSTYLGGEERDEGRSIAVSSAGLAYFAITTYSSQFPLMASAGRVSLSGENDAIVGVMDMTRSGADSLVTSSYFGGSDHDEIRKLALDSKGRVLLTGYTFSSDFPTTPDAVQVKGGGNGDAFVSLIDPSRSDNYLVYSTYLSGGAGEVGYDIAADASGYIYVTGYTLSYDFPLSPDATQIGWGGGADLFVCKLKPGVGGRNGLTFSTYVGETGNHVPTAMAVGSDGTVYIAGYTNLGMPAVGSDAVIYQGGTNDGFVVIFSQLAGQPLKLNRNTVSRAPRY